MKRSRLPSWIIVLLFVGVALYRSYQQAQRTKSPHAGTSSHTSRAHSRRSNGNSAPAPHTAPAGASDDSNLLLGNPTDAGTDPNDYLLTRPQYTLSFNHRRGEPNWVAWHLSTADLGDAVKRAIAAKKK